MSVMTKKSLAASLKKLMGKRPLEKITVKDLVADCGINRQTFYYHFQDIYDLLGWIYKTEALESIQNYRTYDTWQKGFLMIFDYVAANKEFCSATFHSLGRDHLESFLYDNTYELLIGVVEEVARKAPGGDLVAAQEKKFIAHFYTVAFNGLLVHWIRSGMKADPHEIVDDVNYLIEGDIKKALARYIYK